jgi:hypothetical protein
VVAGREVAFEAFRQSVILEDVVATAREVLRAAHVPDEFCEDTLSRLARSQLTTSRHKLIFAYNVAFETMLMGSAFGRSSVRDSLENTDKTL